MDTIGVGLIGSGFMGKSHALAWNAARPVFGDGPRPEFRMLAEADADLAAQGAAEFGFARATSDWKDLLADPAIDAVSLTAPNHLHAEMAIAILEAGKHVWCEKPMAPTLAEANAMKQAARNAGRVAILGYNYIQNPLIRLIGQLLSDGRIGSANHVRVEMDEDFMADPDAPFTWRSAASAGYGALEDFAVHPLSIIRVLFGGVRSVMADMAKPYQNRPNADGGTRTVETYDLANALLRLQNGMSGTVMVNRAAWGRKGRIFLQIFGSHGTIVFDQERFNEVQVYTSDAPLGEQGFRTILAAPAHTPYNRFIPAPGHGLGFNDLKTIECREFLRRVAGDAAHVIDFDAGFEIERTVHAMARSWEQGKWINVADI